MGEGSMGNETTGEVNTSYMLGLDYSVETGDCGGLILRQQGDKSEQSRCPRL